MLTESQKHHLVAQAKQASIPGPFTEDDTASLEAQHAAQVLNYLLNKQNARTDADARLAMRRMVVTVAILALLLGMLVENFRGSLFSRPIVRSMDALTEQLREASAATKLLERIERK